MESPLAVYRAMYTTVGQQTTPSMEPRVEVRGNCTRHYEKAEIDAPAVSDTGWRNENAPNFRTALCNRVIKINEVKSTYSVSKHLLISPKFFCLTGHTALQLREKKFFSVKKHAPLYYAKFGTFFSPPCICRG